MVLKLVEPGSEPPGDEFDHVLASVQADIAAAAASPHMRKDPYGLMLAGLSGTLGVLGLSVRRWERAVGDVIAARAPIPYDQWSTLKEELKVELGAVIKTGVEDGAHSAVKSEVARLVRTLDGRLMVRAGLWAGGMFVLGVCACVATFAMLRAGPFAGSADVRRVWEDVEMANPDPRLNVGRAFAGPDGRRMALFWVDQAKPPTKP